MKNEIETMVADITTTTAEAEDYTGEDGLLYCGKCHTPKEAYFSCENVLLTFPYFLSFSYYVCTKIPFRTFSYLYYNLFVGFRLLG